MPEEIRVEFLRGSEIKRRMEQIRRNPEEIIEGVVNGLSELRGNRNGGDDPVYVPHSWNCEKPIQRFFSLYPPLAAAGETPACPFPCSGSVLADP